MRKIVSSVYFMCICLLVLVSLCWAADFSGMSNQELFDLRSMIKFSTEEVQAEYQEEWEQRLAEMSDEEKKKYANASKDDNTGEQLWVPGKGYESQQGNIIYGGGGPANMISPK